MLLTSRENIRAVFVVAMVNILGVSARGYCVDSSMKTDTNFYLASISLSSCDILESPEK